MAGGRPSEYDYERMKPLIDAYLEECTDIDEDRTNGIKAKVKIPTIEGLCLKLQINKSTLYDWEDKYQEFSHDIDKVRKSQAERLVNKGLSGEYNPTIAKVLLSKHGYTEKQEIDHTTKGESMNVDERLLALASKLNGQ